MSDLISREAVLESLKTDYSLIMFDSYGNLTFTGERIIEAIKRVPSAEPERKTGKWIDISHDGDMGEFYCCSLCKREIILYPGETLKDYPYCHCGTKMEGGVNCNAED